MISLDNHERKGCDTDNPLSQSKLEAKQSAGKRARARLQILASDWMNFLSQSLSEVKEN